MHYVKPFINTGDERNITGHFISGAIGSALLSAGMNYHLNKDKEIDKCALTRESSKAFLQGGAATASAIAVANQVGKNDYLGALLSIGIGASVVYVVEKAYQEKTIIAETE